jgi:hypothetical protein
MTRIKNGVNLLTLSIQKSFAIFLAKLHTEKQV